MHDPGSHQNLGGAHYNYAGARMKPLVNDWQLYDNSSALTVLLDSFEMSFA
jgi:hypothetical protein